MNPCRCSVNCLNRALNSVACVAVASVHCARTGHMPSAAFAKENHDNMKTSEIGIRMLVDDAVPAEQVFYLRRKWLLLGFQVLSPSLPVEVGW